jgi:hypothetical protein
MWAEMWPAEEAGIIGSVTDRMIAPKGINRRIIVHFVKPPIRAKNYYVKLSTAPGSDHRASFMNGKSADSVLSGGRE